MFCPKCGKELPDSAVFCSGCGEKIVARAQRPAEGKVGDGASPGSQSHQNKPNLKVIGIAVAVIVVLVVVVAVIAGSCSSSKPVSSNSTSQASASASASASSASATAAKHDHVTFAEVATLSDVELADALSDEGYDRSTSGSSVTYKKNGRRIDIDNSNGWRGFYLDSGSINDVMKNEAPDYETFSVYKKSGAKDFVIGICEVEGDDGLIVGAGKGAIICKPGYMEQAKKQIMDNAKIEYYMSAQEAAAAFVAAIEDRGFAYSEGDKIGSDDSSTDSSTSASSSASSSSAASASSSASSSSAASAGSSSTANTKKSTSSASASSSNAASSAGAASIYVGTWVDPDYGDTLAIDADGRCNVLQDGNRSIWEWKETSAGIRISNVNGTYDFVYTESGGKKVLACDSMGLSFVKK